MHRASTSRTRGRSMFAIWLGIATPALALAGAASSQTPDLSLWSIERIRSNVLSETRVIRVALPLTYKAKAYASERYPVLIVLDAQDELGLAAIIANARALARPAAPAIPELIVIGVETLRNRYRDTTLPPLDGPARTQQGIGGAPAFAEFLTTELLPFVASRYRSMPFTVVEGHSMTGLFAGYLYGHSPKNINAIVALSSSLTWNGGVAYKQILEGVRARTTPGRFFLAASRDESAELASAAREFASNLAGYTGPTTFEYRELIDDSHPNTQVQGTIDGLRFIFRPVSLAGNHFEEAADESAASFSTRYANVRQQYLAGAAGLGLPARLPFEMGFLMSQWMLDEPNLLSAVSVICEDIVRDHPALWHGHECRGRVRREMGDLLGAGTAFQEALRLAKQVGNAEGRAAAENGLRAIARR